MKNYILFLLLMGFCQLLTAQIVGSSSCTDVIPSAPSKVIYSNTQTIMSANNAPSGFSYRWFDSNGSTQVSTSQFFATPVLYASKTYFLAYYHNSTGCLTVKVPIRVDLYQEDRNWVREYVARDTVVADFGLRNSSQTQSFKSTTYHDGLGREIQQVAIKAGNMGSDIITPITYDSYGRPYRDYLPVPNNSTSLGLFRPTATSLHNSYYNSTFSDSRGYADKTYEASPLNRVLKQGVPGTAWVGHELEFIEGTNSAGDSVRVWTVGTGPPESTAIFPAGTLSKNETRDEDGRRVIEYKDRLGRLILKKVQFSDTPTLHHDGWLCTYYVYDSFGRLRVVMPPESIRTLRASNKWYGSTWNSLKFNQYYMYSYDARGRLITKRLPGKAPEEYVYDLQDRLVASRDSLLIAQGKWHYRKYDALGREVMTGLVANTQSRSSLQTDLDGMGPNNAVINATSGKTGSTNAGGFPSSSEGDVLTVTYYDHYNFKKSTLNFSQIPGYSASSSQTHGLVTGKLVRNLSSGLRYESVYFYDAQGRLIQSLEEHHLSGTLRASTKFDFENKPVQTTSQLTGPSSQTIIKDYHYNNVGMIKKITHKINSGTTVTLAEFSYDELGKLTNKVFPVAANASTSFTYNIRGWLKKINNPQTVNGIGAVFAQELFYESGGTSPQFNGNVSKIEWKGKDDIKRIYNYTYDPVNRLKTANYSVPSATSQNGRYNLSNINYDYNGNITSMNRSNQLTSTTFGLVDQLTYTYPGNGNKLTQVADALSSTGYLSKDFKERSISSYTYDKNGNLTKNLDKEINSITYNHLNLPQVITFTGTNRKIEYQYNAEGIKVRQVNTNGSTVTTLNYLGEFVLEGSAMSYILHDEGRAAYEGGTYHHEFFIKDHLGNVRQVVRAPLSGARIATMEPENAAEEEELFQNIKETRQGAGEHNKTPGGYATAWLNADRGRILGPSRSQEVQEGDSVELGVFGKYVDPKKFRLSPATFARTGMDRKIIRKLGEYGQNLAASPNELAIANVIALVITELQQKPAPEAYMGYALYDADSNLYEQGKVVLSKRARNRHEELIEKIAVRKDGYIETFLVNETSENVWFDQFRIMSTGPLIVQETHYDPWGVELGGLGYQYGGIKVNPYLYNGKEANGHLGVNLYDYGARLYDPAIGRWFVIDPLAEKMTRHSPFNYAFDNPIRFIDPDGMEPYAALGGVKTSGESMSSEDETEKSVMDREESEGDEPVMVNIGYGEISSDMITTGIDFMGNFQTEGGEKSKNKDCCRDENKSNQRRSPNEISRAENDGYGYAGNSREINGKTYYKMSTRGGQFFWVDNAWNSLPSTSFNFWKTYMGEDLQKYFPILQNPQNRSSISNVGVSIFETFYLEKLIRWPFPLPIYVPREFINNGEPQKFNQE
ncbi:DUF6443 domain-containing protein [Algoriphagus sp.]|uniref:DUF6443 domain-containing protein n=1 Tax=Algoriphagus sp. TaxID=1872435 RepID=UPI0026294B6D|nr:DUF6443 domain-containing protein [Algoriphagus sp.]